MAFLILIRFKDVYELVTVVNQATMQEILWIHDAATQVSLSCSPCDNADIHTNIMQIASIKHPVYFAMLSDTTGLRNTHMFYIVMPMGKYVLAPFQEAWRLRTRKTQFKLRLFTLEEDLTPAAEW